MRFLVFLAVALGNGTAQVPGSGWIIEGTQMRYVSDPNGFAIGSIPGVAFSSIDADGVMFSNTWWNVQRRDYNPQTGFGSPVLLSQDYPRGYLHSTCVTRSNVYSLSWTGTLERYNKTAPRQTPTVIATGLTSFNNAWCCDGREIFMSNTAMTELMALDLTRVPPTTRFIARLPSGHTAWATSLGRDRTLIASGSALFQIGIDDGSVVMLRPLPSDPRYSGVHTLCAYDPWTDHIIVGPLNELYSLLVHEGVLSSGSWRQWLYSPLEGLYKLTSTSEQPFELFGRGCPNSTGRDARVTARGLPLQGQTFSLDLRDGEPSAAGLLWLSMSDQFWAPVGTLPYEASALGAPGCTLLVAADIVYAIATNAGSSTALTLRVPINAALHQIELFAQGATSTNVNALTLATSDAIAIRVR